MDLACTCFCNGRQTCFCNGRHTCFCNGRQTYFCNGPQWPDCSPAVRRSREIFAEIGISSFSETVSKHVFVTVVKHISVTVAKHIFVTVTPLSAPPRSALGHKATDAASMTVGGHMAGYDVAVRPRSQSHRRRPCSSRGSSRRARFTRPRCCRSWVSHELDMYYLLVLPWHCFRGMLPWRGPDFV